MHLQLKYSGPPLNDDLHTAIIFPYSLQWSLYGGPPYRCEVRGLSREFSRHFKFMYLQAVELHLSIDFLISTKHGESLPWEYTDARKCVQSLSHGRPTFCIKLIQTSCRGKFTSLWTTVRKCMTREVSVDEATSLQSNLGVQD